MSNSAEPTIPVSEIFGPTVQGEGPDIGRTCLFLRVSSCPVQCPGCFKAGTKIRMADGDFKWIEDVVIGDVVLSYDIGRGVFVPGEVSATMQHDVGEVYRLRTTASPSSAVTYVTGEHPVLVRDKGWVLVRELEVGDHILHFDSSTWMSQFNPMKNSVVVKKMVATSRSLGNYVNIGDRLQTPEARRVIRERMSNDNPMTHPGVAIKGFLNRKDRGKVAISEEFVMRVAGYLGLQFVGDGSLVVGGKFPDFIVKGTKKLVEVWDASQTDRRGRNEEWEGKRRSAFEAEGYTVLFLPVTPYLAMAGARKKRVRQEARAEIKRVRRLISEFVHNGKEVYGVEKITPDIRPKMWNRLAGASDRKLRVYNFEVEGTHTYVADGMVVHNCDTGYTWNGKEKGTPMTAPQIITQLRKLTYPEPGRLIGDLGLVISGGEPLLYYRSSVIAEVLNDLSIPFKWVGLETSGYAGNQPLEQVPFMRFLREFSTVCLSPKITPCLHGRQTDEELEQNIDTFMQLCDVGPTDQLSFKFVVRDIRDIDAILACSKRHDDFITYLPTYLMPYGNDREAILSSIEILIPTAAKYGFRITPRLQALLWGARRGV